MRNCKPSRVFTRLKLPSKEWIEMLQMKTPLCSSHKLTWGSLLNLCQRAACKIESETLEGDKSNVKQSDHLQIFIKACEKRQENMPEPPMVCLDDRTFKLLQVLASFVQISTQRVQGAIFAAEIALPCFCHHLKELAQICMHCFC